MRLDRAHRTNVGLRNSRTARPHGANASPTPPALLMVTVGVGAPDAMSWLAANSTTLVVK